MPAMPRTSKKCQKIADAIQGKSKKKGSKEGPKTETEKRVAYEETSRIR
ncbi:hypothetical protein M0R72_16385 [Candidatus Pacearchaeota archaeon]|jgi:hypothetical protein|nr:hypothetical protein [Candidatus Pacearchaeota archaeon]